MVVRTYDELMESAANALNQGEKVAAMNLFTLAAAGAYRMSDNEKFARARQMQGVCLRLAGWYGQADELFENAYGTLPRQDNNVLAGSILRDWAMNDYDRGHLEDAKHRIARAERYHRGCGDDDELGATLGFKARITDSLEDYVDAEILLCNGNQVYRMNNFIWWMRSMNPLQRWLTLPTVLHVAKAASMRQRAGEAIIITLLGEHAYRAIKQLKRR